MMTTLDISPENTASATTQEIGELIDHLQPILEGKPIGTVVMAALAITYIAQLPTITIPQLIQAVEKTSYFVTDYLSTLEDPMSLEIPANMRPN